MLSLLLLKCPNLVPLYQLLPAVQLPCSFITGEDFSLFESSIQKQMSAQEIN